MTYLALFIGGIAGGSLRYVFEAIIPSVSSIPLNTLIINLSGSLILGLFYGIADVRLVKPWFRVGFGTGVIGAFTTFSTFCLDIASLSSVHIWLAAVYAFSSILGGPLLAFFGDQIVVAVTRRTAEEPKGLSV
jgi:fluoride exporter